MERASIHGAELEYRVQGTGEPVLLVHGSVLADAFLPLLEEPALAGFRLVLYHRRGYAGSSRHPPPFSIAQQAEDACGLLRHLAIERAHVVGHSFGAAVSIQLALDHPEAVHSLCLLEPPLLFAAPSAALFAHQVMPLLELYATGDKARALDAFMRTVNGPNYRQHVERNLPPGAWEMAVADADTVFKVELPAVQQWSFSREDARRVTQPVLAVAGTATVPFLWESHELVLQWFREAKPLVIPNATHALQFEQPQTVAEGLRAFLARHRMVAAARLG